MKEAQEARRAMSTVLLQLQDEERRRIARELHDSTGQNLSALLMALAQVKSELPKLDPECRRAVVDAIALAKRAAGEVRTFSYLLHPPLLDELGLEDALRSYVQGFRERSGMAVKLLLPRAVPRLPQPVELALFRILQESLNNARRHSGSSKAVIRLKASNGRVRLTVRDFGRGLKNSKSGGRVPGVGIAGMRERVWQLGGTLEVISARRGTAIHASIPLSQSSSDSNGNSGLQAAIVAGPWPALSSAK
jgi:signal transduction histidine kinase